MGRLWAPWALFLVVAGDACSLLNERVAATTSDAAPADAVDGQQVDACGVACAPLDALNAPDACGPACAPPDALDAPDACGAACAPPDALDAPDACGAACAPVDAFDPLDACAPTCGARVCGDNGCGGTCGTCAGSTACDASGACAGPVLVDHFDDLTAWVNTTDSTTQPPEPWTIDSAGVIGSGAKSRVGGFGFGDQLERSIEFATASTLRIWANKISGDFISVTFKVDGAVLATYNSPAVWTQLEFSVPAGSHTVRIESNFAGTAWVDELEVFSTP